METLLFISLHTYLMDLGEVQQALGVRFCDEGLLRQALTHSSCLNEPQMGLAKANESLAWLGDALIHWVVSEHIFNPEDKTEMLTERRKTYVNKGFLAGLSKKRCLDKALRMTGGEEKRGGRRNQKNLHTVYEAVVGAIIIDKGFDAASRYVMKTCIESRLGSQ